MKIREYRESWKLKTPEERLERYRSLWREHLDILVKASKPGTPEWRSIINFDMTNKGREMMALESLCKDDCLGTVETYQEDEWINKKFSHSWGDTPTEAYEGVREFLKGIKGVSVADREETDHSNSHISFSVLTKYYVYDYETRYSIGEDGYMVYLKCNGRFRREPTDEEWRRYVKGE